jgi:hypothetical protein
MLLRMQGWESNLSTVACDELSHLQQEILFYRLKADPFRRFGKRIDHKTRCSSFSKGDLINFEISVKVKILNKTGLMQNVFRIITIYYQLRRVAKRRIARTWRKRLFEQNPAQVGEHMSDRDAVDGYVMLGGV